MLWRRHTDLSLSQYFKYSVGRLLLTYYIVFQVEIRAEECKLRSVVETEGTYYNVMQIRSYLGEIHAVAWTRRRVAKATVCTYTRSSMGVRGEGWGWCGDPYSSVGDTQTHCQYVQYMYVHVETV